MFSDLRLDLFQILKIDPYFNPKPPRPSPGTVRESNFTVVIGIKATPVPLTIFLDDSGLMSLLPQMTAILVFMQKT